MQQGVQAEERVEDRVVDGHGKEALRHRSHRQKRHDRDHKEQKTGQVQVNLPLLVCRPLNHVAKYLYDNICHNNCKQQIGITAAKKDV